MLNGGARPLARARRRLAMGDVDAAGILYFAAPYRWHEELFSSWFATIGHPVSGMLRAGTGCPCVDSSASYAVPLTLDDEIELHLRPSAAGRTSFALHHHRLPRRRPRVRGERDVAARVVGLPCRLPRHRVALRAASGLVA
jgi:acyl-CoA thioesterase FadM